MAAVSKIERKENSDNTQDRQPIDTSDPPRSWSRQPNNDGHTKLHGHMPDNHYSVRDRPPPPRIQSPPAAAVQANTVLLFQEEQTASYERFIQLREFWESNGGLSFVLNKGVPF